MNFPLLVLLKHGAPERLQFLDSDEAKEEL